MATPAHNPARTCVGTGAVLPQREMVRWVLDSDGELQPDWTGRTARLTGRGAWCVPTVEALERATARGGFARALKTKVPKTPPDVLIQRLVSAGERLWTQRLGLALRARVLAVGEAALREAFPKAGRQALLIVAADAGTSNRSKFESNGERKGMSRVTVRTGASLGAALGREYVSALLVSRSPFAEDLTRWGIWLAGLPGTLVESMSPGERSAPVDSAAAPGRQAPALGPAATAESDVSQERA